MSLQPPRACLVFGLTISLYLFEIFHCCFFPRCITFKLFLTILNLFYLTELCDFWFGFATSYIGPSASFVSSVILCALFTASWRVYEILSQSLGGSFSHTLLMPPSSTVIATNLPTITCFLFKSLFFVNCLFIGRKTLCLKTIALACSAHDQNIRAASSCALSNVTSICHM